MQFRFIAVFLICAFAPLAFLRAQSEGEKQVSEFEVNGLKVLVKRRPGVPTVAAALFIKGGSTNLKPETAGIESLMLNVSTEATKSYPREMLRKELARTATNISSSTGRDYSGLVMASTKQNFDESWKIFTDVALNPSFAPEDVDRVRGNVLTALRAKEDAPDQLLQDTVERTMYTGHPYANDPEGTPENIAKFTPAELAAYHKRVMQTSQLLLVIVGDVDPATVQQRVTASFGTLPRGAYKMPTVPALDFSKPALDVVNHAVETDYVQGSFGAPSPSDSDYYPMRVAISILQTQVYQEVRTRLNLSYAPDAGLNTNSANNAFIYVTTTKPNEAVGAMLSKMKDLRENEVTEDTIRQYGNFFLTTYYIGQETDAAQAGELARYELLGGGWRNSFGFIDRLRQVTPAQVKAVSQKYMKNVRFDLVGSPTGIDRSIFLQGS
ncbi:MAG: M16 family metallopeptidase [Pyrinomonadaceae bacterium]